jgi:hypothetical protein
MDLLRNAYKPISKAEQFCHKWDKIEKMLLANNQANQYSGTVTECIWH